MGVRSAGLFLEGAVNRSPAACLYKAWIHKEVHSYSTAQTRHHFVYLRIQDLQLKHHSMKHKRLSSLPLLPTITETLEDLPVHPSAMQPTQGSQSLDDYMTSIQALACTVEAPSYGPVRLQRSPRLRQLSKGQMKLSVSVSVSVARASPRTLRTSRPSSLNANSTEDFPLRMSRERDCRGKDPVDWLFGQIKT